MHPELLNNSIFLRYYKLWQMDPSSVVFAAIAEYLIGYQMYEQAIEVCHQGLKNNPDLVSGRLALAKAYLRKKEYPKAKGILKHLLLQYPRQEKAMELWNLLRETESPKPMVSTPPERKTVILAEGNKEKASWQTVTMAKIYAAQGHKEKARQVYQLILQRDPQNREAREGLEQLEGSTP